MPDRSFEDALDNLLGHTRRAAKKSVADQAFALARQARKVAAQWRAIAEREDPK